MSRPVTVMAAAAVLVAVIAVAPGGPPAAAVPAGATPAGAGVAAGDDPSVGGPAGRLDEIRPVGGGLHVAGWAFDPDTTEPIVVHVYVDATGYALDADEPSPAVEAAFPGVGPDHGFGATVPVAPGEHRVCVYALNVGPGETTVVGCRDVTVTEGPVGIVDDVRPVRNGLVVSGWTFDPDTTDPIDVHVYVDGAGYALTADGPSPAVEAAFGAVGPDHAFTATVPAEPGPHRVCVYAINTGPGATTVLGCRVVPVPFDGPVGYIDEARMAANGVRVSGWAYDDDTTEPIDVHVYVDGQGVAVRAGGPSPTVQARFPGVGPDHAFSTTVSVGVGEHDVCVYGINVGAGASALIGCRTVRNGGVPGSPVGMVTAAYYHPRFDVHVIAGWAFDPDTTEPIRVTVVMGGVDIPTRADFPTPELEATYPGIGPAHGYYVTKQGGSGGGCALLHNVGPGEDVSSCLSAPFDTRAAVP